MAIPEDMKNWIDTASYAQLLERWRFGPVGSPWFQGEVGDYYAKVMGERHAQVGDEAHTAASKAIGWDRQESRT
ncbi:MAG: hypothetical protein V2A79_14875 [Planctomycetota bacterium]